MRAHSDVRRMQLFPWSSSLQFSLLAAVFQQPLSYSLPLQSPLLGSSQIAVSVVVFTAKLILLVQQ